MRFVSILLILVIGSNVYGQSKLTEEEKYLAWLDSMKSETYIAIELTLDELEVLGEKEKDLLIRNKRRFNLNNTDQFLHRMPGMVMVRRGNFAHEPMLRGLTSERYAISIDGMRIFGACTDKMDPVSSYIEPINLRSLDVSFGAQSNGIGGSTGGAINFNLKKPVFNLDKPLFASIGMHYGSNANTFDQSVDFNYSTKKIAIRLSGVHRDAANYLDGNNEEVRYSQYEKYNHAASLSYRLNETSLLMLDYVGDNAYNVGYPALPMDVSSAKANMFALTYIAPAWNFLKSPEIKVYHNFIKHVMDDTKRDSVAMHMDMPGETETTGAYIKSEL
ncbi:MAG: TonB-dependent receptor plug domain-containing protein, partial [Fulvivirga sp.]|uniref:TonB-dependent receptor plug domain-containing protein n=1 Tax=Fulvivirga sp. TaxID=1931237 RepID=UPI0032EBFE4D